VNTYLSLFKQKVKMTNFLNIIHRLFSIKNTWCFGDWSLSPSSGKRTPTLLGPIDRASPYLQTTEVVSITKKDNYIHVEDKMMKTSQK
jgi:hypothetical protein